jgi:hypothetical protein
MAIKKVTLNGITHAVTNYDDPRTLCEGYIWWEEDHTDILSEELNNVSEINCNACLLGIKEFQDIKGKVKL